ncbi:MAG TPA: acylglycerol kinase family protein [Dongiaceae bacterium]|nr:acylglycerol kinase family protein [Dongiaceae bacterium]
MTAIGVISNARSTRNVASMQGVHEVLAAHPEIPHHIFHKISDLRGGLHDLAARGVNHIVISGGDGTVQAGINELLQARPFNTLPAVSIIAGGMTNVVARDVGLSGKPAPALKRLIERVKSGDRGELIERRVISLSVDGGNSRTYGFVAGAVGFYQGTMLSRHCAHRIGLRQMLAANVTIAQSLWRLVRYGPGPRSGFTEERAVMSFDGAESERRDVILLLFTTLQELTPGIKPFWGDQSKGIKYTIVDHPPKRFIRAVYPALRGRNLPWMEQAGYHSGSFDQLHLHLRSPIVMDGELFKPGEHGGLNLSVGPAIPFHRF